MYKFLSAARSRYSKLITLPLFVVVIIHAQHGYGEELPKIELGLGVAGQYLPDYRGSDETNAIVLPIPIFIYRGDRIKISRGGVRGELVNTRSWEINLSAEAALNGDDGGNEAREGMPELDSSFEIGPSLNVALDGNIEDDGWLLRLPVRAAIAVGSNGFEPIGFVINPRVTYVDENFLSALRFSASFGALWASEKNHDYFYQVDQAFVRDDRPFFDAEAGFSGISIESSFVRRDKAWLYGVAFRYDNIGDAVFADSPLIRTDDYFSVSFIWSYFLWSSDS